MVIKNKKMKYIIYALLLCSLFLFGCEKEEVAPLEISDFSVHVGRQGQPTAFKVAIADYLTFLDISQNALEHEWRISENSVFLNDEFTENDTIYTDFVIPSAGKVSTEKKINVLFTAAGLQPVQIVNTFAEPTTMGPATAVQQGDVWVIDTTYLVDVFADIEPAFKIFKGDEEVLSISEKDLPVAENAASWINIELETGQTLTFVNTTSVGRPNHIQWSFPAGQPATSRDSAATISFFQLGTFTGGVLTTRRINDLPQQSVQKLIPIQVTVVPSSEPFLFEGNLMEQEDETITFNVGGELAPFSGQEGTFTVTVVNDSAGFNQTIAVETAKVSDEDATKIELVLAEPIYNSDFITVSYSGTSIKSADSRTLSDFGPETVEMFFADNILPTDWAGFEIEDANWKKAFASGFWVGNGNGSADNTVFTRTEEFAASGVASMLYQVEELTEVTLQGSDFKNFGLAEGSYKISLKVYLDPANTMKGLQSIVQDPFTLLEWDISDLPRGEWVEISQIASFVTPPTKRFDLKIVAANNPDVTGAQTFYVDDYSFITVESRP